MFIRQILHRERNTGKVYYDFKLVESIRTPDGKVKQNMLLNLGTDFNLAKESWPLLTRRIKSIVTGQLELFEFNKEIESLARRYAKLLIEREAFILPGKKSKLESSFETIDVNNLKNHSIKTIGGEHVTYNTIIKLGLDKQLINFGLNKSQANIAIGSIIGRMLNPGSELSTHEWLQEHSGLDELIGCDFSTTSHNRLYRASDNLLRIKNKLEKYLCRRETDLFSLKRVITLYDLTNTYFEGSGKYNEKAAFGRSKDKRNDCPLVTLGLVLDREGFPLKSEIFAGNASEPKTLKEMIVSLEKVDNEKEKPIVVLDAGIATEENLKYLKTQSYDYLVVSRQQKKDMPKAGRAVIVKENKEDIVKVKRVEEKETNEIKLYCYSEMKAKKEQGIANRFTTRFENELIKLQASLRKKTGIKVYEKVLEKIGRLKEKYKRIARYYKIDVKKEKETNKVKEIIWSRKSENNFPGVYCIRTSKNTLDAKTIWNTYVMLTEIESAFRSMKSELGMRPVFHQKTHRVDGHLFITLLAYHVIHTIRYQLKSKGINFSWKTLRDKLNTHFRLTTTMTRKDGKIIHIRKSSMPNESQREIYDALGLSHYPGKTQKTISPI